MVRKLRLIIMIESYSSILKIRRSVFEEVAKLAYEGDYKLIEEIPYQMLNGQAKYRESIFLERAIVAERIRLAIGLPVRSADEHAPISKGIEEAICTHRFYEPPLVNVIDFACNACPTDSYFVTDSCVGCLANPCANVCPKDAIKIVGGKSIINQDLCIKCGRCKDVCPYKAIVHRQRPCEKACGMHAIESDEFGRAKINYDKCVSCGMCIVNCPFGAIADKSQIFQVVQSLKSDEEVYAIMAPAFVGQFGPKVNLKTIDDAMQQLGFTGVYEVSIGADLCTYEEALDFLDKVPSQLDFMGTFCCPSWSVMAKMEFPEYKNNISMQRRIMGKYFFPFFSVNIHKYIYKLPILKVIEKDLVEDMRLFLIENLWLPDENGQYKLSVIETVSYERSIELLGNPIAKRFADNEQGIKVQYLTWIIDDAKSELSATYLLIDKKWQLQKYQVRIKEVANNAG